MLDCCGTAFTPYRTWRQDVETDLWMMRTYQDRSIARIAMDLLRLKKAPLIFTVIVEANGLETSNE